MPKQISALERLFQPHKGELPVELARYLLQLDFTKRDHVRYQKLSQKAQSGSLTAKEKDELDDLLTANDVLTILQSKARVSIRKRTSAA